MVRRKAILILIIPLLLLAACSQGQEDAELEAARFEAETDQRIHELELQIASLSANRTASDATYVVASSNAPDSVKAQSDYSCDGLDDDVQIQAAIDALPSGGGRVYMTEGIFFTGSEITISGDNVQLVGSGYGTKIVCNQGRMLNSINITANHVDIRDLMIEGFPYAEQLLVNGAYAHFTRVYSTGHALYNLLNINNISVFSRCKFFGQPVKSTGNAITFSDCYFNGNGRSKCLIVDGVSISIRNNCFETYAGSAIDVAYNEPTLSVSIIGNHFETEYPAEADINVCNATNLTVLGNYAYSGADVATSLLISGSIRSGLIDGNQFGRGITITGSLQGITIKEFTAGTSGISYNTLIGLTYLEVIYRGDGLRGYTRILGTSPPATGDWLVGDRVINVGDGENSIWKCDEAGTPGIWNAY